jgi:hypothetical protein
MNWKDRVKEFRRVPASELKANPKNWREHPPEQRKALGGVLDEVGIAGALLARETEDGLELIDGHLRTEMDDATKWPVLILDVDEDEADIILATSDPIGAMASQNDKGLTDLIASIKTDNAALGEMLDAMEKDIIPIDDEKYSTKIESPIYEIKGERPNESELFDETKTKVLVEEIEREVEDPKIRGFLVAAARRHTSFQYDSIAEYYAHAPPNIQKLMEESALVIIDFDRAIELGFVKLTEELAEAYRVDHEE